jgi:hypothetical protein
MTSNASKTGGLATAAWDGYIVNSGRSTNATKYDHIMNVHTRILHLGVVPLRLRVI